MKLQYIVTSSRIWFDVYFECIVSITALFDTMELEGLTWFLPNMFGYCFLLYLSYTTSALGLGEGQL